MCNQCQKNPVYEFTNKRKLCARCFIRYFQKKVFYIIRKFKMLKNGDIIFFEDKDDFRSAVLKDALQIFSEKANVALLTKKNKENKITKTALPFTIDLEADKIIHKLIKEDIKTLDNVLPVTGKRREIVKPLYLFLDGEVLLYARLRKLKFKPEKSKEKKTKDKISLFIDSLEKKHPELKRAVVKSWLRIKGI